MKRRRELPRPTTCDRIWTPDQEWALKFCWLDLRSAGYIAEHVVAGKTRNAVLGKVRRMGMVRHAT